MPWGWVPPLVRATAWFSAALSSVLAVCLAAGAGTLPSPGSLPAEMPTAPGMKSRGNRKSSTQAQSRNFSRPNVFNCWWVPSSKLMFWLTVSVCSFCLGDVQRKCMYLWTGDLCPRDGHYLQCEEGGRTLIHLEVIGAN